VHLQRRRSKVRRGKVQRTLRRCRRRRA
jgi:hypothetical protein